MLNGTDLALKVMNLVLNMTDLYDVLQVNEQLTDASEESIALAQRLTALDKKLAEGPSLANASPTTPRAADAAEEAGGGGKLGKLGRKKK